MKFLTLAFVASNLVLASAIPAHAQDKDRVPTLSLSATGKAVVVPDMATLALSVLREAKTARAALDANNKAMSDIMAAMREVGIAERDLQTSQFYIQPKYKYYNSPSKGETRPPEIVGYSVSNSLTVRVRDLSIVGAVLDRSVSLGVNNGGGISFGTSQPDAAFEEARKNAVERAMAKARTLTETAGIKLGRIVSISEQNTGRPVMRAMAQRSDFGRRESAAVPIAAGEGAYEVGVKISWELEQ